MTSPQSQFTFFIVLVISRNTDEFSVEIGWSRSGLFPDTQQPLIPSELVDLITTTKQEIVEEARFRLGFLWQSKDYWWSFVPDKYIREVREAAINGVDLPEYPLESSHALIQPLVKDAMDKIIQYGIPFCHSIMASWGHEIQFVVRD